MKSPMDQPTSNHLFYQSYLDLALRNPEDDPAIDHTKIVGEHGKSLQAVKLLVTPLIKAMIRPQRLILDNKDYYVAIDMMTNTFYICYRTLMMIDIDFYKGSDEEKGLMAKIEAYAVQRKLRFAIYKSRNGVHIFLTSHSLDYTSDTAIQMMLDLTCDFYYVVYSYNRGWSVRLNRKEKEEVMKYEYVKDVGTVDPLPYLMKLVKLHLNLVEVFKNEQPSLMFGN